MQHRDMKSVNATGKMSLIDLLDTVLPQTSQFAKKTTICQAQLSAVKRGIPVLPVWLWTTYLTALSLRLIFSSIKYR